MTGSGYLHGVQNNIFIEWWTILITLNHVWDGMTWIIGNGPYVQIGRDPWIGCENAHLLPPTLIQHLLDLGHTNLAQIVDPTHTNTFR